MTSHPLPGKAIHCFLLPASRYCLFAASRCRFYCRFYCRFSLPFLLPILLPLLVAVSIADSIAASRCRLATQYWCR